MYSTVSPQDTTPRTPMRYAPPSPHDKPMNLEEEIMDLTQNIYTQQLTLEKLQGMLQGLPYEATPPPVPALDAGHSASVYPMHTPPPHTLHPGSAEKASRVASEASRGRSSVAIGDRPEWDPSPAKSPPRHRSASGGKRVSVSPTPGRRGRSSSLKRTATPTLAREGGRRGKSPRSNIGVNAASVGGIGPRRLSQDLGGFAELTARTISPPRGRLHQQQQQQPQQQPQRQPWSSTSKSRAHTPPGQHTPRGTPTMRQIDVVNHFPVVSWEKQWEACLRSPTHTAARSVSPRVGSPPTVSPVGGRRRQTRGAAGLGAESSVMSSIDHDASTFEDLARANAALQERCNLLENKVLRMEKGERRSSRGTSDARPPWSNKQPKRNR